MNQYLSFLFCIIGFTSYGQNKVSTTLPKLESYHYEALILINKLRSKNCSCGNQQYSKQKPLAYNKKLEKAAAIHARDLYSRKVLSHIGKNGSKVQDRIKAQGYNWKSYAENVAEGYETIEEVFDAWMKSKGHCKSIMGNYQEFGIFKVNDYWVLDFGIEK
ncbi:MAG: CAP domain-containing protein [Saprospiraceae bacterium]